MASLIRQTLRRLSMGEKYDLSFILARAKPDASLGDRIEWLEQLVDWIRYTGGGQSSPVTRIRFLFQILERNPEWKKKSGTVIRSVFLEPNAERWFSETGMPTAVTFTKEFLNRFVRLFVPSYDDPKSLASVSLRVFYDGDDAQWLRDLPDEQIIDIAHWIEGADGASSLLSSACDACTILVIQASAICLREDLAERSPEYKIASHPLLKLETEIAQLSAYTQLGVGRTGLVELNLCEKEMRTQLAESRKLIASVRSHLEEFGVSVDLVYQLDRVKNYLERIEILSDLIFSHLAVEKNQPAAQRFYYLKWRKVITHLIQGQIYDSDFSYILRKNLAIISRKIVERTGVSGEHYITQNSKEYWHMFMMAAGGGLLTAFTAWGKYVVSTQYWPMFLEILYNTINYSVSFVIMHYLGFKLATKQPSMTAAALASKLKQDPTGSGLYDDPFVQEVKRISRSQFAAIFGNLAAVIPMAWIIDRLWVKARSGEHFLSVDKAHQVLETMNPIASLTVFYAALTGIILWVASMTAGWVENALVYYRVPEIIARHKVLRNLFGPKRAQWLSDKLIQNTSGVAGAVSLGFYLAFLPVIGKFFGLPIDVRHVTLSTGTATYAISSIGLAGGFTTPMILTSIGIFFIGLMNFGVSFLMALIVAVRAQELPSKQLWRIMKRTGRDFLRNPFQFFFPGKSA